MAKIQWQERLIDLGEMVVGAYKGWAYAADPWTAVAIKLAPGTRWNPPKAKGHAYYQPKRKLVPRDAYRQLWRRGRFLLRTRDLGILAPRGRLTAVRAYDPGGETQVGGKIIVNCHLVQRTLWAVGYKPGESVSLSVVRCRPRSGPVVQLLYIRGKGWRVAIAELRREHVSKFKEFPEVRS
jgi:hypothetical protein